MNWNQSKKTPVSMGQRKVSPDAAERPVSSGKPGRKRISINLKGVSWGLVFGVATVVALISGGIFLGQHYQSNVTIQSVAFEGYHFTGEEQLMQKAAVPTGISADSLRLLSIIEAVESLPYVQMASVRLTHNGRIHIQVKERQPIGLFIHGNRRAYVDETGVLLPLVPGRAADVPLVYGVNWSARQDTLRSEAFNMVRDFLMAVHKDAVAFATLSEIAWTPDEGIVALSNENGIRLVFGRDRFPEALQNWNIFYRQVVAVRGPGSFTAVDLRYDGQIVTRETS
jgi:cell division protein FtsQ